MNELNAELEAGLTTQTAGSNHEKYTTESDTLHLMNQINTP